MSRGQALQDAMLNYNHRIGVKLVGEMLPNDAHRVTPADDLDQYGLSVSINTVRTGQNDRAPIAHALDQIGRSMKAIGARDVFRQEDDSHHLGGAARMDEDPVRSVLGSECRRWNIPGFWACDRSVFPTVGAKNPALTIQRIAVRTAARVGMPAARGEL